MEDLKCPKCGAENQFYTEMKANNNVARCSLCDAFIKNIPQGVEPTFFFGKYKGQKVAEIEDMGYLRWALEKLEKLSPQMRTAIEQRINSFENLAR